MRHYRFSYGLVVAGCALFLTACPPPTPGIDTSHKPTRPPAAQNPNGWSWAEHAGVRVEFATQCDAPTRDAAMTIYSSLPTEEQPGFLDLVGPILRHLSPAADDPSTCNAELAAIEILAEAPRRTRPQLAANVLNLNRGLYRAERQTILMAALRHLSPADRFDTSTFLLCIGFNSFGIHWLLDPPNLFHADAVDIPPETRLDAVAAILRDLQHWQHLVIVDDMRHILDGAFLSGLGVLQALAAVPAGDRVAAIHAAAEQSPRGRRSVLLPEPEPGDDEGWSNDESAMRLSNQSLAVANIETLQGLYPLPQEPEQAIDAVTRYIEHLRATTPADNAAWHQRHGGNAFDHALHTLSGTRRFGDYENVAANYEFALSGDTTIGTAHLLALIWHAIDAMPANASGDLLTPNEVQREQETMRWGVFMALASSIDEDDGHRVCSVGKSVRLALTLAGHIRGLHATTLSQGDSENTCQAVASGAQAFVQEINAFRHQLRQEAAAAGIPMDTPDDAEDACALPIPPEPTWERLLAWIPEAVAAGRRLDEGARAEYLAHLRDYLLLTCDEAEGYLAEHPLN